MIVKNLIVHNTTTWAIVTHLNSMLTYVAVGSKWCRPHHQAMRHNPRWRGMMSVFLGSTVVMKQWEFVWTNARAPSLSPAHVAQPDVGAHISCICDQEHEECHCLCCCWQHACKYSIVSDAWEMSNSFWISLMHAPCICQLDPCFQSLKLFITTMTTMLYIRLMLAWVVILQNIQVRNSCTSNQMWFK